jgi:hypothetical protein
LLFLLLLVKHQPQQNLKALLLRRNHVTVVVTAVFVAEDCLGDEDMLWLSIAFPMVAVQQHGKLSTVAAILFDQLP